MLEREGRLRRVFSMGGDMSLHEAPYSFFLVLSDRSLLTVCSIHVLALGSHM